MLLILVLPTNCPPFGNSIFYWLLGPGVPLQACQEEVEACMQQNYPQSPQRALRPMSYRYLLWQLFGPTLTMVKVSNEFDSCRAGSKPSSSLDHFFRSDVKYKKRQGEGESKCLHISGTRDFKLHHGVRYCAVLVVPYKYYYVAAAFGLFFFLQWANVDAY